LNFLFLFLNFIKRLPKKNIHIFLVLAKKFAENSMASEKGTRLDPPERERRSTTRRNMGTAGP
jgi:hypothetical protein